MKQLPKGVYELEVAVTHDANAIVVDWYSDDPNQRDGDLELAVDTKTWGVSPHRRRLPPSVLPDWNRDINKALSDLQSGTGTVDAGPPAQRISGEIAHAVALTEPTAEKAFTEPVEKWFVDITETKTKSLYLDWRIDDPDVRGMDLPLDVDPNTWRVTRHGKALSPGMVMQPLASCDGGN